MIAIRSAGVICDADVAQRRLVGADLIAGRHGGQVEVQDQQPAIAEPGVAGGDRGEAALRDRCHLGTGAGAAAGAGAGGACATWSPAGAAGTSGSRWNSTNAMSCGWPSSVTTKSRAVSPSTGLPSLSFTVTVCTTSRVPLRKIGCSCCCGKAAAASRRGRTQPREPPSIEIRICDACQNLTRRLLCRRRIWLARFGRPNCGLPTKAFTPE